MCVIAVAALVTAGALSASGGLAGGKDEGNTKRGDRAVLTVDRVLNRELDVGPATVGADSGGADDASNAGSVSGLGGSVGEDGAAPEPGADRGENGGLSGFEALIADFFPEAPYFMIAVFRCESVGFRDDVVYGPTVSRTEDRGLAQINVIHSHRFAARGWDYFLDAFDPVKSLTVAREIYDIQGVRAWTCA